MNNTKPVYTLITGASEGLGKALSIECARRHINLVLVALPGGELHTLAAFIRRNYFVGVLAIEKDLCRDLACRELFNEVSALGISVNMLINNAGLGGTVRFDNGSLDFFDKQIRLNVLATTLLSRLFIDSLSANEKSYLLNVGSLASFFFVPRKQVYGATKSFIYFFSRTLQQELPNGKVNVSVLCPGGMNTNPQMMLLNKTGTFFSRLSIMDPDHVAAIAIDGLLAGKRVIIPGKMNRLCVLLDRLLPFKLKRAITKSTMKNIDPDNRLVRYLTPSHPTSETTQAIA